MFYTKMLLAGSLWLGAIMQQAPAPVSKTNTFRVVGKSRYQVVDTAGFFIYSINKLVQGEKISRAETVFYFSASSNGPLRELTRANLEETFASNTKFRYALEQTFRSDKALMEYDRYLGGYKVKYLYRQAGL